MKKYTVSFLLFSPVSKLISLIGLFLFFFSFSKAQKLDVAYVPTPYSIVEKMLDMADVGPGDYVIDLGSGDGRIVIAAAKRGALGHGVDLDPERVKAAQKNAEKEGVTDRVVFVEQNIFDTDFSKANVVAMYLFPDINIKLRPLLLQNLEPGSRIVSHDFQMDEWQPDEQYGRMETHSVYLWIVPAKAGGIWNGEVAGEKLKMTVSQEFQKLTFSVLINNTPLNVENSLLSGRRISFALINPETQRKYVFSGQIEDDEISGIVQIHDQTNKSVEKWTVFRE